MLRKYYEIAYDVLLVNIMLNKWFKGMLYLQRDASGINPDFFRNNTLLSGKMQVARRHPPNIITPYLR